MPLSLQRFNQMKLNIHLQPAKIKLNKTRKKKLKKRLLQKPPRIIF